MRNPSHLLCIATALFVAVSFQQKALAQTNLTTEIYQNAGANWTAAIWLTNAPGIGVVPVNNTYPGGVAAVAGNTYEEVPNPFQPLTYAVGTNGDNTRLRNPTSGTSSQTFPGDSLTLDNNTEIRFKAPGTPYTIPYPANFPGVNGNPGLILNGGFIDDGDNGTWNIQGSIAVVGMGTNVSVLAPGGNIGNPSAGLTEQLRTLIIGGQMSGSGTLALVLTPTNSPVFITNGLNTFDGNWIIQEGWLIGTTPQCLGSANITVDPLNTNCLPDYPSLVLETSQTSGDTSNTNNAYAVLDFDYAAICTGALVLTNGGLMNLHTNCIFGSLVVEGTTLPDGTYTYSNLTVYPYQFTNFLPNTGGTNSLIIITPPVAPPAPTNLSVAVGANSLAISWNPAPTATGYIINRSTNFAGPYTQVGTTNDLTYVDTGLTQFQTYYYEIQATNAFGVSPDSVVVSGTPSPPVTGVMATANPTSVALSWNSYSGATSYTVGRTALEGGKYTILSNGITSLNYTDSSVANGTLYYYEVVATLSTGGTSAPGETNVLTYPSVPVIATDLYGTSGIFLQLSASDPQTPGYLLNVSSDGIHFSPLTTLSGGANNFLDTGLNEGTEYYFDVQATNSSGVSAVSAVVSNAIPVGTISFAFGTGLMNAGNPPSPAPLGYIQDIGLSYYPNGTYSYGWVTNTVSVASGWDMSALGQGTYNPNNPPGDLRKDSFIHQTQDSEATNFAGLPASSYPFWAVSGIPNGLYQVRVVSGDATANDSIYQQVVNGVSTPTFTPSVGNYFAQWMVICQVTNNTLTVAPGTTNNDKINYIDIYPAVPPVAAFTLGPTSGTAPLTVNFTNISTGSYSEALWTFGDGGTSNTLSSVVTYTYTSAPATNTVSLSVDNGFGTTNTYTLTNAVTVNSATLPRPIMISHGTNSTLVVNWSGGGQLLQATNITGPWTTNIGATAPFTVSPTNSRMFFRTEQ